MRFTRQDALTFAIGLLAALGITLGQSLIDSQSITDDPTRWALTLLTGLLAAGGRYLVTYLAQRGITGGN